MSRSGDVSFVSRFVVKFLEIIVAGLATAVSGYVIAHLSGAFSTPPPTPSAAVIQAAPSTSMLSGTPQPMAPVSSNSNEQTSTQQQAPAPQQAPTPQQASTSQQAPPPQQAPAPQQEVSGSRVTQPGSAASDTVKPDVTRKRIEKAATTTESGRQRASLHDRVRAALTNVDANRKERLDASSHRGDLPNITTQRPPPASTRDAAPAPPIDAAQRPPEPLQAAPIQPNPLPSIEITSRPITDAQSPPAPSPEKETGVLSRLEQMLRNDPPLTNDNAPRPPMPVGQ